MIRSCKPLPCIPSCPQLCNAVCICCMQSPGGSKLHTDLRFALQCCMCMYCVQHAVSSWLQASCKTSHCLAALLHAYIVCSMQNCCESKLCTQLLSKVANPCCLPCNAVCACVACRVTLAQSLLQMSPKLQTRLRLVQTDAYTSKC